jgi:hypothetical protein
MKMLDKYKLYAVFSLDLNNIRLVLGISVI